MVTRWYLGQIGSQLASAPVRGQGIVVESLCMELHGHFCPWPWVFFRCATKSSGSTQYMMSLWIQVVFYLRGVITLVLAAEVGRSVSHAMTGHAIMSFIMVLPSYRRLTRSLKKETGCFLQIIHKWRLVVHLVVLNPFDGFRFKNFPTNISINVRRYLFKLHFFLFLPNEEA